MIVKYPIVGQQFHVNSCIAPPIPGGGGGGKGVVGKYIDKCIIARLAGVYRVTTCMYVKQCTS